MALSKLEIQQMLREMNVKFHADDTYEELKLRLQHENHALWLKSVSGDHAAAGSTEKVVVRKRKKDTPPQDQISNSTIPGTATPSPPRSVTDLKRRPEPDYRQQAIEKPAPGKPWKAAADGTEPFNRKKKVFDSVLRRARRCCEHCGVDSKDASKAIDLEPFHILPLEQGGEHSIKNVVALCPACLEMMANDPDAKTIKDLKRKTRSKIYDSLQVVRKRKVSGRRGHSRRRK